jgi:hypothetical protein
VGSSQIARGFPAVIPAQSLPPADPIRNRIQGFAAQQKRWMTVFHGMTHSHALTAEIHLPTLLSSISAIMARL